MQIIINGESKTLYSTRDEAIYREITAALESDYDANDDLSVDEWESAMSSISEIIDTAGDLPEGYRAVEVAYGAPNQHWDPLGVILKAEVWIDSDGQLRVSDGIFGATGERGDPQEEMVQDGGNGSLHGPSVIASSSDPNEFARMLADAASLPSVIVEYAQAATKRCETALSEALARLGRDDLTTRDLDDMAIGDYTDDEGTPGAPSIALDDDGLVGRLVAWEPVPTSLKEDMSWDLVSTISALPPAILARLRAWQTRRDGRVTGAEFAARRHLIGLTLDELAERLSVNPRTVRSWESERDLIPERITGALDDLLDAHAELAQQMATDGRPVGIIRDKTTPTTFPRGWYVAAAARALVMEPDLEVEWV